MQRQIKLNSQRIDYELRRNKRNKYIRISVNLKCGLLVTVPPGTSFKSVEEALQSNKDWILDKLTDLENRCKELKPALADGDTVTVLGETHPILIQPAQGKRFSVGFDNVEFKVHVPQGLTAAEQQAGISRALSGWFTHQAKIVIPERAALWAKAMNLEFNRITVKDQKSRWGSCSQLKNLNFNWRLMMAPLPILDYVIVHELAHLCELNHSANFWQLVESFCPGYKLHKKWLKIHGKELFVL